MKKGTGTSRPGELLGDKDAPLGASPPFQQAAKPQAKDARPASLAKLAEEVATRIIARTPLAESGLDRPIRAEFVEIVSKYGPPRPSAEFARRLLDGLDAYLQKAFPDPAQLADPVRRDEAYLGLLPEIRDLQWKLYLAVGRRPLDAAARDRLEEQHDWMRQDLCNPARALIGKHTGQSAPLSSR